MGMVDIDSKEVGDTFKLGLAEHEIVEKNDNGLVLENGVVVTEDGIDTSGVDSFSMGGS